MFYIQYWCKHREKWIDYIYCREPLRYRTNREAIDKIESLKVFNRGNFDYRVHFK